MRNDIKEMVIGATNKMKFAYEAEGELNAIFIEKREKVVNVIARNVDVITDSLYISWQPADGWIITDGDWEYVPSQNELIKLLSL